MNNPGMSGELDAALLMAQQETDADREARARKEARAWLVCLLGSPTARNRREFEVWRNSDPANAEAFGRIAGVWDDSGEPGRRIADQEADELAPYLESIERAGRQRKTGKRLTIVSIVLAAMVVGAFTLERPALLQNLTADYVTNRGERRQITLADGSTVLLDADSALDEDFGSDVRRVRLLRGAAFFTVTPSTVPFVVTAADSEIKVLGTGFDVRLVDGGGVVTLDHGKVAVTHETQQGETVLKPGEQVSFGETGIGTVETASLDDALAWRDGRFVFYRARLGDVIREIERYRRGRIILTSSALADERVTGSLSLDDPQAALASLQASVGFRVHGTDNWLTVVRP